MIAVFGPGFFFPKASAKVLLFADVAKEFYNFFSKKISLCI